MQPPPVDVVGASDILAGTTRRRGHLPARPLWRFGSHRLLNQSAHGKVAVASRSRNRDWGRIACDPAPSPFLGNRLLWHPVGRTRGRLGRCQHALITVWYKACRTILGHRLWIRLSGTSGLALPTESRAFTAASSAARRSIPSTDTRHWWARPPVFVPEVRSVPLPWRVSLIRR